MGFLRARTKLFLGHGRQPGVKRFLLKHELKDNVVLQGIRAPLKTVSWNLFLLHNEAGKKLPAAAFHTEAWHRQKETFFFRLSPENEHLCSGNHFAFISSCLHSAMLLESAATELQGELLNKIWRV